MFFYTAYQNQKKNRHSKKSERFNKPNKDRKTPRLNRIKIQKKPINIWLKAFFGLPI